MTSTVRTGVVLMIAGAVAVPAASTAARSPTDRLPSSADVALANSARFSDPAGDAAAGGMDVTNVTVSNDDAGKLTFAIEVPAQPTMPPGKEIQVAVDADRNRATGSPNGNEYAILLVGNANTSGTPILLLFYRWDSAQGGYRYDPGIAVAGSYAAGVGRLEFSRMALGGVGTFDFELFTGQSGSPTVEDAVPNTGKWTYEIKIGTTPASSRVAITSLTKRPTVPVAGESFTVSVTVRRVGRPGAFRGTVYCSTLPGVQKRWFGSVVSGRASCRWDIPANAAGKTIRGSIGVSEGGGPVVTRRFTATVSGRTSTLLAGGANTAPPQPEAGRRFYYALTVIVRVGGTESRIRRGVVDCKAAIGGRLLRVAEESVLRSEGVRCAWEIPRGTTGQTMVGSIFVKSGGAALTHRFTRRVR
jgi:hypothetical protein